MTTPEKNAARSLIALMQAQLDKANVKINIGSYQDAIGAIEPVRVGCITICNALAEHTEPPLTPEYDNNAPPLV